MSRYRMELATRADDADLRRILSQTPMAGAISVGFRREPSYFEAAAVDGRFRQVVSCRDTQTGRLVGFGCRSVRERYVNGRAEAIGYLSNLRLLPEYRNRGLIARGYAYFRKLHADGRASLYLTTIAEDNRTAQKILTSGRAGLPAYHYAGKLYTAVIPLVHRPCRTVGSGLEVRPATVDDLPAVLAFLQAAGPKKQFFPCYQVQDFFEAKGTLRDLLPKDLLLAWRNGRLIGTLAGWDQHAFRQTVVCGYSGALRWLFPVYNSWAWLRGVPPLPVPGQPFHYLTAALPVVDEDDPQVFASLLDTLLERIAAGSGQYLLIGLHEADPLLDVVRSYRPIWFTTCLYLVCWEDGEVIRARLDGRVPYLELGSL